MAFKLGFKLNPILRRHGWAPKAGRDWDKSATAKELSFWREQGYEALELLPDHYTKEGLVFDVSDDEWREIKAVVDDSGMRIEGILGWRRMTFREPWASDQEAELEKIAKIGEILEVNIIDVQPVFSLPMLPSPGAPTRQLFRSLWDATTADFELSARSLKRYAQRVRQFGASLALQMHPDGLCDIPKSTFRLMEMIDETNVGINPDTFDNAWIYPDYPSSVVPSAAEQCRIISPHVNYWHAKNWERSLGPDGLWKFSRRHLDEGDQPIGLMSQHLVAAGFDGAVIMECGRGFEYSVAPATLIRSRDYLAWIRDVYAPEVPLRKYYGHFQPEVLAASVKAVGATPGS
jgi:sugar phosphate isomerase/epimerase